ncbi:carbonyl reductase family member 4-like [Ixodes scapularis]|uniref:carbonyl reductase family member 4-like n=1 Tax=Ixodes scapularis TaxID=6945 RepID=UPI001A9D0E1E|nr:carbonyl reductase family member 4-like [Ixodes scapularis]
MSIIFRIGFCFVRCCSLSWKLPTSEAIRKDSNTTDRNETSPFTQLGGRLALVTGGASEIGRSVTKVLAREGVTVFIANRNVTNGEQTIKMLRSIQDCGHMGMSSDLRNSADVEPLFKEIDIKTAFPGKKLSFVVKSAEIRQKSTSLSLISDATFNDIIVNNLRATLLVTRKAVKSMVAQNGSKDAIVNIASTFGRDGVSANAASKGAVLAFTESLALELSIKGIRVNAILPGLTDSPRVCQSPPEVVQNQVVNINPTLSTSKPEEISEKNVLILSP